MEKHGIIAEHWLRKEEPGNISQVTRQLKAGFNMCSIELSNGLSYTGCNAIANDPVGHIKKADF